MLQSDHPKGHWSLGTSRTIRDATSMPLWIRHHTLYNAYDRDAAAFLTQVVSDLFDGQLLPPFLPTHVFWQHPTSLLTFSGWFLGDLLDPANTYPSCASHSGFILETEP